MNDQQTTTDERHTMTVEQLREHYARAIRGPGEVWIQNVPWGRITTTIPDRQSPALPKIYWT